MTRPLSVAVLVKQVPLAEEFRLGADGRAAIVERARNPCGCCDSCAWPG
jgi:hypothetical protein